MADKLPLTVPVHSIVTVALRRLRDVDGLDRDEAYLLARLEQVDEARRTDVLIEAIDQEGNDGG